MSNSIVSTVSRFLSPEIVGKMASAAGMDRGIAQSAVTAAVPAILGGLANLASKPAGVRQIADAVAEQPSGLLGNLAGAFSGSSQIAATGSSLLSSLLGDTALGGLASTIGKFTGAGESSTRTLLGMLTPAIMGVLGREQRAQGLDGPGVARMLSSQKVEIADAMPEGLSRMLDKSGAFDNLGATANASRPYQPDRTAPAPAYRMAAVDAAPQPNRMAWAYWLLPLLALAGLLWHLFPSSPPNQQASEPARTTAVQPNAPVRLSADLKPTFLPKGSADWVSVGAFQNQDVFNRAGEKLGTVKDLLVGPEGRIDAAVVGIARQLGLGEKDIAVPLSSLQVQRQANGRRLVIDAVRDALQTAPAFVMPTKP